ncbi:MAG: helix-turn-helix domain-containing protein [Gammaproteobacteria bacterium]|nr:helix-turn-helix domain-containing protein [Gammaproteobacteria bacterium]
MTEATDKGSPASEKLQSAGEQLRRARESRNLTIQQVAQALHLDPWILEALEQNRFKDVGAPVFVKGHMRKYAAEVGLDAQQLMEAYYRAEDTPETPGLVTDTFTRPGSDQRGRWPIIVVSGLIVLLIMLAAFVWLRAGGMPSFMGFGDDEAAIVTAANQSPAAPVRQDDEQPGGEDVIRIADSGTPSSPEDMPDAAAEADVALPEKLPQAVVVAEPETSAAAVEGDAEAARGRSDDGQMRVSISLQNDSWLEIYDADNRRLFFDLARSGTTRNVTGKPPLQVLLGNAEDARVRVDGSVWPIPAAARRGKTARFTIR